MRSQRIPDEIVVVNDGGDDSLRKLLYEIDRNTKIIYAKVLEDILWNYNGACNLGVWLSTGNILALEDCDHIPDRDLYANALKIFKEQPDIDRLGVRRKVVKIEQMKKSLEEWQPYTSWGSNQMVTLFRRDVYLKLKGQDERMRKYGWLAYDWASRYKKLNIKSAGTGHYFALVGDEGEPDLPRGMSMENRAIYRQNANTKHCHSEHGILNFQFTYEVL